MIINHKHKYLFLWNPKAAGTSIVRTLNKLDPYCANSYVRNNHIDVKGLLRKHNANREYAIKHVKKQVGEKYIKEILPETLDRYFKFMVVRNPWARLYSAWNYLKSGAGGAGGYKQWEKHVGGATFQKFLLNIPDSIMWLLHFRPQVNWAKGKRRKKFLEVDQILRVESLESDFYALCSVLDLPKTKIQTINTAQTPEHFSLEGWKKPTSKKSYKHYYNTKTIDIVGELYKEDIEYFGYEFE